MFLKSYAPFKMQTQQATIPPASHFCLLCRPQNYRTDLLELRQVNTEKVKYQINGCLFLKICLFPYG